MAESDDKWANRSTSPPAPCSPLSSRCCSSIQTWLPVESPPCSDGHTEPDEDSVECLAGMKASRRRSSRFFYEELFCTSQASIPLPGALMTSSGPQSDVVKQGYLGKLERSHRRYFVLRAGSHTGPSRLEWYKSQQKFTAVEKSVGKAALFESRKQGVIYLRCCLGVSRIGSSRKGHTVALYAKDQTMVLVMENEQEQEGWYVAMKKLMEEEQRYEEQEEGLDEEDDGYCTLPPAAFFKEVWPVTVKPRDLGSSKSLTGESRLCLTAASLILVRVSTGIDLPSVSIPLLSVRRFGHWDGLFFLELGRSAPNGPGEIWMEARDQDPALAQHIHEAVRDAVRSLRALPDFTRSPISSHSQPQALLASKRCRPKYRDKPLNVRPPGPLVLFPRNPDMQTSPSQSYSRPCNTDSAKLESYLSFTSRLSPFRAQQSCKSETGSYMEMRMDQNNAAASGMQQWESVKEEDGPDYMIMSPSVSHSSSVLPKDDYVTMASPHKHEQPAYDSSSSLQTSFISSSSDSCSPPHPSRPQTSKHSLPQRLLTSVQQSETDANQSQMSIGCSARPLDDVRQQQRSAQTTASAAPAGSVEHGCLRLQTRPNIDTGQFAGRRRWLSSCLPSCLQTDDRS